MFASVPWDDEPKIMAGGLVNRAKLASFFHLDLWHLFHLGICKHWIGSSMVVLIESGLLPQRSVEAKFEAINEMYHEFCKDRKLPRWVSDIGRDSMNWPQSSACPVGGWNKGSASTTMMLFLDHVSERMIRGKSDDAVLKAIVPRMCFLFFLFFPFCSCIQHSGLRKLLRLPAREQ